MGNIFCFALVLPSRVSYTTRRFDPLHPSRLSLFCTNTPPPPPLPLFLFGRCFDSDFFFFSFLRRLVMLILRAYTVHIFSVRGKGESHVRRLVRRDHAPAGEAGRLDAEQVTREFIFLHLTTSSLIDYL